MVVHVHHLPLLKHLHRYQQHGCVNQDHRPEDPHLRQGGTLEGLAQVGRYRHAALHDIRFVADGGLGLCHVNTRKRQMALTDADEYAPLASLVQYVLHIILHYRQYACRTDS